jgi:hypothetical protein
MTPRRGAAEDAIGEPERRAGREPEGPSRIPARSVWFSKVIPAVLIGLGILMVLLIALAAGILIGIVPYR